MCVCVAGAGKQSYQVCLLDLFSRNEPKLTLDVYKGQQMSLHRTVCEEVRHEELGFRHRKQGHSEPFSVDHDCLLPSKTAKDDENLIYLWFLKI